MMGGMSRTIEDMPRWISSLVGYLIAQGAGGTKSTWIKLSRHLPSKLRHRTSGDRCPWPRATTSMSMQSNFDPKCALEGLPMGVAVDRLQDGRGQVVSDVARAEYTVGQWIRGLRVFGTAPSSNASRSALGGSGFRHRMGREHVGGRADAQGH